jgi:uncharacterized protein (DUF433 family)
MSTAVIPSHIHLDERGRAWIDDTNTKVIEVALGQIAYGWSAYEIHRQYPHLSLAQIHAALAHYFDHQAEYDAEIENQAREHDEKLALEQDSPLRRKLRAAGKLR